MPVLRRPWLLGAALPSLLLTACASRTASTPGSPSAPSSTGAASADALAAAELAVQGSDSADARNAELFVVRVDGSGLRRLTRSPSLDIQAAWSPDGRQLAFISDRDAPPAPPGAASAAGLDVYVMNADGSGVRRLTYTAVDEATPAWAPDGRRLAFVCAPDALPTDSVRVWAEKREICVMNVDGSGLTRLTRNAVSDAAPSWSPDGRRLAFTTKRDAGADPTEVYVMDADGGNPRRVTANEVEDAVPAWSPTGEWIAFTSKRDGNSEVYIARPDGSQATNLSRHPEFDAFPSWSPDGRHLAFVSRRGGANAVYVMTVAGTELRLVTAARMTNPKWRPGPGHRASR